jgi:Zn-dependent oligopeptidase
VVAVVASFAPPTAGGIGFSDIETLLHELGHALHSLLSRTRYQHLSGTQMKQALFAFGVFDQKISLKSLLTTNI